MEIEICFEADHFHQNEKQSEQQYDPYIDFIQQNDKIGFGFSYADARKRPEISHRQCHQKKTAQEQVI
jgi:hypothetical protein